MVSKKQIFYEAFIALLALLAVIMATLDLLGKIPAAFNHAYYIADNLILLIFICDYGCRFLRAEDRKKFFKQNILDLISIIPFSSLFRVLKIARLFRLLKLVRLLRAAVFFNRFNRMASSFLKTNGFVYVLYATLVSIITGSAVMCLLPGEAAIKTYPDALWWAFVTATTVGYGDISPSTGWGRIVAASLMIVGIGFISMLTGTIATFFLQQKKKSLHSGLIDLSELDEEEAHAIMQIYEALKNK